MAMASAITFPTRCEGVSSWMNETPWMLNMVAQAMQANRLATSTP